MLRYFGLLGAGLAGLFAIWVTHNLVRLPDEPVWDHPVQIWENFDFGAAFFFNWFEPPNLPGLTLLLLVMLGGWSSARLALRVIFWVVDRLPGGAA